MSSTILRKRKKDSELKLVALLNGSGSYRIESGLSDLPFAVHLRGIYTKETINSKILEQKFACIIN